MGKVYFETTVRVTRESCKALARARASQHICAIWLCNAAIALGVAILWSVDSRDAIWLSGLLLLLVLHTLLRPHLTAARLYAARNAAVDTIRLAFTEEGIGVRSSVEESLLRYSMITSLKEDASFVMIYMRHHTPLVVCKADMGDQTENMKNFLKEKTGIEIRMMNR